MGLILEASCHDRLTAAVTSAVRSYGRLEILISCRVSDPSSWSSAKPRSAPPWNSAAANMVFEFRHEVRSREQTLRTQLGHTVRPRGGSDKNTAIALKNMAELAEAAGADPAASVSSWLERWHGRAARVLGEASPVVRLPRQPGEKERPCPFCRLSTLRYIPLHGIVICIKPGCQDDEGRKPRAAITYSEFTGSLELCWQDGVLGLPALPEEAALCTRPSKCSAWTCRLTPMTQSSAAPRWVH